ncbi:hypothetical protein CAC42_2488 [Sphaceloma murrayae]|uniref:Uncharacterized protein n=1 Tax=Sphaceloma murrayae TaxID=2082308 RepID=A0A2K1QW84_9PEZI|nr:hypothetical protein CAC42_2488 [Sphaceloma murrayae]
MSATTFSLPIRSAMPLPPDNPNPPTEAPLPSRSTRRPSMSSSAPRHDPRVQARRVHRLESKVATMQVDMDRLSTEQKELRAKNAELERRVAVLETRHHDEILDLKLVHGMEVAVVEGEVGALRVEYEKALGEMEVRHAWEMEALGRRLAGN